MTTEAANDDAQCYYRKVLEDFRVEWNKRYAAEAEGKFQADDMFDAHGNTLGYMVAMAVMSGHNQVELMNSVVGMIMESADVNLALLQAPKDKKDVN
jgi:hypothetical protein